MSRQHKSGLRGIRPLIWWLLLFLALYGIRLNQRLLEQTRLYFSITLNAQSVPYPITVTWDGKPIQSGDKISLGNHHFSIQGPKSDSFTTNIFVLYGKHDFGEIRLRRSRGTLSVKAAPPAEAITISGPEFSTNFQDVTDVNQTVPTDIYTVEAQYRHWSNSRTIPVADNGVSTVDFTPKFGALNLTCNRDGATFRLLSESGQVSENGDLPAVVADLPVGDYEVTTSYHAKTMQKTVRAEAGRTNDVPFQFVLGTIQLKTVPPGAEVRNGDGSYLGQTPLLLEDITPPKAQFTVSLAGYEPVSVALDVTDDETNCYATNLVSVSYLSAIRDARAYLSASNYEAAFQTAEAALKAKPGDPDALVLKSEAGKVLEIQKKQTEAKQEREEQLRLPRVAFNSMCSLDHDAGLFAEHELTTEKPAKDVEAAIVKSLEAAPMGFKIVYDDSPHSGVYQVMARQTFSLGILGGTQRDCLLVVGQASDNETEVFFKVLEYQIQTAIVNLHEQKQLVPVSPSRIQMNDILWKQLREGAQIVGERIQRAIGQ